MPHESPATPAAHVQPAPTSCASRRRLPVLELDHAEILISLLSCFNERYRYIAVPCRSEPLREGDGSGWTDLDRGTASSRRDG